MPFKTYSQSFGIDPDLKDAVTKAIKAKTYKWGRGAMRFKDRYCFVGMILDLNGTPPIDGFELDQLVNRGRIDDLNKASELANLRVTRYREAQRILGEENIKRLIQASDHSVSKSYEEAYVYLTQLAE